MNAIIDWAMDHTRMVLTALVMLIFGGLIAYASIPKESDPDIPIPVISISIPYPGISPEDAERLIVKPLEVRLKTIEGIKEMRSVGAQGYANTSLEFDVSFDKDKALEDVRAQVDLARGEIPDEAKEPVVSEINTALQPVITINLSGDVPERTLSRLARQLSDDIEAIPAVLETEVIGIRDELIEIIVDPAKLVQFGVTESELFAAVARNNQLVAAGQVDTGEGRFQVKVPGLFESHEEVLRLPIKVTGDSVVTLADLAEIRRTFWDRTSFARLNGKPGIAIDVTKRIGENIIETVDAVRAVVEAETKDWPESVVINYSADQSRWIATSLSSLQSTLLTAVFLVMVVVVAAMSWRSALLVGFAIPTSFLIAFLLLSIMGYTVNMMVMFGLILAVGMLVDGGIIVVEYADRQMSEGVSPEKAYRESAKRMFWPVISSTLTTIAAFAPLLLWPGVSGQFMKFLPITVITVLAASIVVGLIFTPVVGAIFGRPGSLRKEEVDELLAQERGDVSRLGGFVGTYVRLIGTLVRRPLLAIGATVALMTSVIVAFANFNNGVEFFIDDEPQYIFVIIQGRGNLSVQEARNLVVEVEERIADVPGIDTAFTRTRSQRQGGGMMSFPADTIGTIFIELKEFEDRPPGDDIIAEIRERTKSMAGILIEVRELEGGPPTGKDVQIELRSDFGEPLFAAADIVRRHLNADPELMEVEDTRPLPGIEWQMVVDREQAGRFGADVAVVGAWVQLVTNGVLVGTYRPEDSEDEIDIRVRFPIEERGIGSLDDLQIQTRNGLVPITNFVKREARPLVDQIDRVDGKRILEVRANTVPGVLADDKIRELTDWIAEQDFDERVSVKFRGANEEQAEAGAFLVGALLGALFLMAIILITQFNNFYHAFLILLTVVLSTVGVLLGMLLTGQTFSVIMTGTGIVALAGVVVNNNIVLIDTYQHLRRQGLDVIEAIVRTGAQRLRPVYLTTITVILGLIPMALAMDIDIPGRAVHFGGGQTGWWVQLATAVIFGLSFATILTLIVTPCMLALPLRLTAYRDWILGVVRLLTGAIGRRARKGFAPGE